MELIMRIIIDTPHTIYGIIVLLVCKLLIVLFELLPTRMLSHYWGYLHQKELPTWLRSPLLGLYVKAFSCNMAEAEIEQLTKYRNLCELFTRRLKPGVREICHSVEIVSPCDGKVLHCGRVEDGHMEQVKGVSYSLDRFFGPSLPIINTKNGMHHRECDITDDLDDHRLPDRWYKKKQLFHLLVYLGPGDYHHFHSPANWVINHRRHFHGHLITVAPWAAKRMKGFLSENERVLYSGSWSYGFFSLTAVGAYNIGSIKTTIENDLQTNQKSGNHMLGQFSNKRVTKKLDKGDHMGVFNLGSSVVIIFEAPNHFEFDVKPGDKIKCGEPLGMKK